MKTILVSGGLGFIGSHTCVELLNNNYNVIIIDDLSNSKHSVYKKIKYLAQNNNELHMDDLDTDSEFDSEDSRYLYKPFVKFYYLDLAGSENLELLDYIFSTYNIYAVIHFAGYKAVNESINKPLLYYSNNLYSTIRLLITMNRYKCYNLIFSSSSTVYGVNKSPLNEIMIIDHNNITNPYARTKFFIEQMLRDMSIADKEFNIICLRYFNPIGAHPSGIIGEDPNNTPNNIMPFLLKVLKNRSTNGSTNKSTNESTNKSTNESTDKSTNDSNYDSIKIFGNDYNTPDGTCIRDYIHVMDVASGHLKALEKLNEYVGYDVYNLGTGTGTSVLELINSFTTVNNVSLPYFFTDRREGDIDIVYCDPTKANNQLNWFAKYNINDMVRDSYNYSIKN